MKKIYVTLVCILTLASVSQAQIKYGIRAGVSSSSLSLNDAISIVQSDNTTQELKLKAQDSKLGFHFGGFAQISIAGFFVQPELLLSSTGGDVAVEDVLNNTKTIAKQRFLRMDIPLIAGMKFGPARIGIGPVASFNLSSNDELKNIIIDEVDGGNSASEKFETATWALQAGVGLDIFNKLVLDFKYEFGLSKLGKGITIDGKDYPFSQRNSQFIFSVGINLGS